MVTEPGSMTVDPEDADDVEILFGTLLIVLGIVTISSNGLVLLAFMTNHKLRQIGTNYYIAILALSDLSIGLFVFMICGVLAFVRFDNLNDGFYITWEVLFHYCLFGSVWIVIMISYDRFLLVSDPAAYQEKQTPKHVMKKILFLCLIGLLSIVTMEIVVIYTHSVIASRCDPLNMWEYYTTIVGWTFVFVFIGEFFIPLTILIVLNGLVIFKLKKRAGRKLRNTRLDLGVERKDCNDAKCCLSKELKIIKTNQDKMCINYEESSSGIYYLCKVTSVSLVDIKCFEEHTNITTDEVQQSKNGTQKPLEQNRPYKHADSLSELILNRKIKAETKQLYKAARWMGIYVAILIVCWVPYYIISITAAFKEFPESYYVYYKMCSCLLWSNAIINPFLYPLMNLQYRKVILHLLRSCCRYCKRDKHDYS